MTDRASMYDAFSADYDRFVNWEGRLVAEMPFVERQLESADAHRVLDAACGTGRHALALRERGYHVVGADISAGMIDQARSTATKTNPHPNEADEGSVTFEVAGFGELGIRLGNDFDALLCLGNSLPHVLTSADLAATLADFAACLRPGGILLIQNRNFDAVVSSGDRWMDPQAHDEEGIESLCLRFYDFEPGNLLTFNLVTMRREGGGGWRKQITSTGLWPQTRAELTKALTATGFEAITCFGDLQGARFDAGSSPNLVVTALGPC